MNQDIPIFCTPSIPVKYLPHVYQIHFGEQYNLAMHFWRVQEYYESPKYRGRIVPLVDYMEWYAVTYGKGSFTYAYDWSGFNVPSWVLKNVYGQQGSPNIPDFNKYDFFMRNLYNDLARREAVGTEVHPFYLIGTSEEGRRRDGDAEGLLRHEMAHALYFTNDQYRAEMERLASSMPDAVYCQASDKIKTAGYHEASVLDEIQAYAATGPQTSWGLQDDLTPDVTLPFEAVFKKYYDTGSVQVDVENGKTWRVDQHYPDGCKLGSYKGQVNNGD